MRGGLSPILPISVGRADCSFAGVAASQKSEGEQLGWRRTSTQDVVRNAPRSCGSVAAEAAISGSAGIIFYCQIWHRGLFTFRHIF